MKIVIHGPLAGYGPDGNIASWAPDTTVEVDDADEKAVAWAKAWVDTPHATLVEDVKAKPEPAKEPAKVAHPAGRSASK